MKKIYLTLFSLLFISSCISLDNNFEGYYWKLTSIEGEKVPVYDNSLQSKKNTYLIFHSNNKATGFTGCNIVNSRFDRERNVTHFLGLVTSRNECPEKIYKFEKSFVFFLQKAEYMIINGDTLTIYNKNKDITLIFKKEEKDSVVMKKSN
jgi:heat shock protein HslJ